MDVKGKIAVINGASSGIGKALALELAERGATVVMCARREEKLKQVLEEVKKYSPNSMYRVCDCTEDEPVRETVKAILGRYGRVDIMVNQAGFFRPKLVKDTTLEDYYQGMNVIFFGTVRFNSEVLPVMLKQGGGIILNTSSIIELVHSPWDAAYACAKAATYAYSDILYREVRYKRIHVGVIIPVVVKTELSVPTSTTPPKPLAEYLKDAAQGSLEGYGGLLSGEHPLLRMQEPEDAAREIVEEGIEKELFEIFIGLPKIGAISGIMMKMLPGLGRGTFSLMNPVVEAMGSIVSRDPESIKSPVERLTRRVITTPKLMARVSTVLNTSLSVLGVPAGMLKELFVTLDEGVNRTIYETSLTLMQQLRVVYHPWDILPLLTKTSFVFMGNLCELLYRFFVCIAPIKRLRKKRVWRLKQR